MRTPGMLRVATLGDAALPAFADFLLTCEALQLLSDSQEPAPKFTDAFDFAPGPVVIFDCVIDGLTYPGPENQREAGDPSLLETWRGGVLTFIGAVQTLDAEIDARLTGAAAAFAAADPEFHPFKRKVSFTHYDRAEWRPGMFDEGSFFGCSAALLSIQSAIHTAIQNKIGEQPPLPEFPGNQFLELQAVDYEAGPCGTQSALALVADRDAFNSWRDAFTDWFAGWATVFASVEALLQSIGELFQDGSVFDEFRIGSQKRRGL